MQVVNKFDIPRSRRSNFLEGRLPNFAFSISSNLLSYAHGELQVHWKIVFEAESLSHRLRATRKDKLHVKFRKECKNVFTQKE